MNNAITVIGLGYVGLANIAVFSNTNMVYGYDKNSNKVNALNYYNNISSEEDIQKQIRKNKSNISGIYTLEDSFGKSDIYIICISTDYNKETGKLNTLGIEQVTKKIIDNNNNPVIIVSSTVPVGFIKILRQSLEYNNIYFIPEFIREGHTYHDTINPSRIVIGSTDGQDDTVNRILTLYTSVLKDKRHVNILKTGLNEAESIKLFSNAYLAARVAIFNEIDTYAEKNNLNATEIINGMCFDQRIGNYYNDPSFGYGGYCLPKDTKQATELLKTSGINNGILTSINDSNNIRKQHIADSIIKFANDNNAEKIGFYRLIMKSKSDNYRGSATIDILNALANSNFKILIYEPLINAESFNGINICNNLKEFVNCCDVFIADRVDNNKIFKNKKIYTRSIREVG